MTSVTNAELSYAAEIRDQLASEYDVDDNDVILDSFGKFHREPLYVAYFYECMMNGHQSYEDYSDEFGTWHSVFEIDADDRAAFPTLPDCDRVVLWTSEQGFVHHACCSLAELDAEQERIRKEVCCSECGEYLGGDDCASGCTCEETQESE